MEHLASIITALDAHQGAATVFLTAVLIVVTLYYAVQNARMVGEMQRTRKLVVMPKLAIEFHRLGPTAMSVAIKNVGPGAALGIDVRLIYVPANPEHDRPERRWRRNVLASGEQYDFMPPGGANDSINTLTATYSAIRLLGSMTDASGANHEVDESFDDLREWREVLSAAHERWVSPDPERRLATELGKTLATEFRTVTTGLDRIASVLAELHQSKGPETD
jgi:hypothetical protein